MLAILRVLMFVMNWINRRQFERKVTKFLQREKAEGSSSESPDGRSLARDAYRRKTFNVQEDEESSVDESLLN